MHNLQYFKITSYREMMQDEMWTNPKMQPQKLLCDLYKAARAARGRVYRCIET